MRGTDLPAVQARLALSADEQFTHPESGTCRNLFDCGELPVTAQGALPHLKTASVTRSPVPSLKK